MRLIVFLLMLSVSFFLKGQPFVSDSAEIAIVTVGPYQGEVWSAFGHTGIRVYDPGRNVDWFFDYGVFDFEQENFFLNFAKGLLKYKVAVRPYDQFIRYQKSLNRSIKEQYLNLRPVQKSLIVEYLLVNIKPEKAEYLYNYVYDNCATKIPEMTSRIFGYRIVLDHSYKEEGKTIRDLMDDYLAEQPWGDFGIDIGLGMQIDKVATGPEYMFLPDYVFKAYENASIFRDSTELPLLTRTEVVYSPVPEEKKKSILTPLNVFIVMFFLVGFVTNRNLKSGKRSNWIDVALFSVVGFAGWWVVYLWFGTEHLSKSNLNILWAIPFHLPIAFLVASKKFRRFMKIYFQIIAYWYCALLVVWAILPQPLGMPLVPLVLAMILRAFYISYDLRKQLTN